MAADIHNIIKYVWPEWKVIDPPIGKGAFGTVYKAVRSDMAGESYSAIKMTVIPRDGSELEALRAEGLTPDQTSTYLQRIVQDYATEIKMMMSVKGYTNIVTIDDYQIIKSKNESVWCILIRMELLTPLTKHIAAKPMDEEAISRLGVDLCTALDVCSSKAIIHRDIKPENIFVNEQGIYKLGDFGVARNLERITNVLSKKGTPNYMAPEVYKATVKETDFQAACKVDIYSLGMVLYWISNSARLPFLSTPKQLTSPEERRIAFTRRMDGETLPPPENVSPALQKIILKACAYRPEDRYGSAKEMRDALYQHLQKGNKDDGVPDPPPNPPPDPPRAPGKPPEKKDVKNPPSPLASKKILLAVFALVFVAATSLAVVLLSGKKADTSPSSEISIASTSIPSPKETLASSTVSAISQGAVTAEETPVSHTPQTENTVPGFLMTKTAMEVAANDVFSAAYTWNTKSDVPYQHFPDFPIKLGFDFGNSNDYKAAVNETNSAFSIAYSTDSNTRQTAEINRLPIGFDLKYELSHVDGCIHHLIRYQINDNHIQWKTSSDSDTIVVSIHCGNFSRRLYYSKSDMSLVYFS